MHTRVEKGSSQENFQRGILKDEKESPRWRMHPRRYKNTQMTGKGSWVLGTGVKDNKAGGTRACPRSTEVEVGLKPHTKRNHRSGTRRSVFWIDYSNDKVGDRYWGDFSSEFSSTVSVSFLSCFVSVTYGQ